MKHGLECRRIPTPGGPEDLVIVYEDPGPQWLVAAAAQRPFGKKAGLVVVELDEYGNLPADPKIHNIALPDRVRPAGMSVFDPVVGDGSVTLGLVDTEQDRLALLQLDLVNARIRSHSLEAIQPRKGKGGNDLQIFQDGAALISRPKLCGITKNAWSQRAADGTWGYSPDPASFPNGIQKLSDGKLLLAEYGARKIHLVEWDWGAGSHFTTLATVSDLPIHPDNFAVNKGGDIFVAGQRSLIGAGLHLFFGTPAAWDVLQVIVTGSDLSVSPTDAPDPGRLSAVSTAVKAGDWWYYGQIRGRELVA